MKLKEFAQAYIERQGWSVIPCLPKSKKAAISWKAYQDRLPNMTEVTDWFTLQQDRNLAIITGDVSSRLLVIDFDDFSLWCEWWTKLYRRSTLSVLTGKGIHLYFRLLDETPITCGKFSVFEKPAGDIRYNGGYVLAPPSIHPTGQRYRWIDAPLLSVHFGELKLDRPKTSATMVQQRTGRPAKTQPAGDIKNPNAYAESALRQEITKIAQTGPDSHYRNNQLYESAVKLAKYIPILGVDWIRTRLIAAAHSVGLDILEASKTVNSGLNKALVRSV